MDWQTPYFASLVPHPYTRTVPAELGTVFDFELCEFSAAQAVVQHVRQNSLVPFPFQGVSWRRLQQLSRLRVAQGKRLSDLTFDSRPLYALDRVLGDSVLATQVLEQRGEGGQLAMC